MEHSKNLTLLHGSCFDFLPSLPTNSIDALITDPPYATTDLAWDKKVDWPAFWEEANRVCKENAVMVFFSAQPFTTDLINSNRRCFRYELIWTKIKATGFLNANRRPLTAHENILVFSRRPARTVYNPQKTPGSPYKTRAKKTQCAHYRKTDLLPTVNPTGDRHPKSWMLVQHDSQRGYHPTQKPVDLLRWLVLSFTNQGDTVLDPFMGSGTTGVACQATGRRFIGMEREEEYYNTARQRLS